MPKKSGTSEQKNELPIKPWLVSVKEAADILGCSKNTIRKLLVAGQLRGVRIDRFWRVRVDSIQELIESHSS
jgi:excisionase family DNA binding protein